MRNIHKPILVAVLVYLLLLCGRSDGQERTPNFVAASSNVSRQMLVAAELARVRSAKYWIGRELPNWSQPCPIQWKETGSSGGGATNFKFYLNGDQPAEVSNWDMHVEGRRDKVIADVIPHEVDHAVRASIVRKRIVRVLDEGSATLMESPSTSTAIGFLQQRLNRGESLRGCWDWIEATKYPSESHRIGEMYEFAVSLVRYLVQHHGKDSVLELSKHYPRVLPHWDRIIGESPEATREKWLSWHLGKTQTTIVYVGTSPGYCPPCNQFKDDFLKGRLPSDVEYRFIKPGSVLYHQVAKQVTSQGYAVPDSYPWFFSPRCNCQPRVGYQGPPSFLAWLTGPLFRLTPRPPATQRYRRQPQIAQIPLQLPPPPGETAPDVPDVEKTTRIRELERQVAELRQQVAGLKPIAGKTGPAGPVGERGPVGPPGPAGSVTTDDRPIDVQIVTLNKDGTETLIAKETYPRGTPIRLRFREEWIRSGE